MNSMEKTAQKLLEKAGVEINGRNSWDIQVHNPRFYSRVLSQGTLGLGESYMDGDWDCQALDQFFYRVLRAELDKELRITFPLIKDAIKARLINLQSPRRAFQIGERHYDTGNDLYSAMLDSRLVYTCAYWDNGATNLDDAQEDKLELVCKKIGLKEGERVLDIGGGWGSFAKYSAEQHGANVKATTVSKEQAELGRVMTSGARGVEIALEDYRDTKGKFDHVVSLGMFEHVGPRNYRTYMEKVSSLLEDDGLFLLHTIGSNKSSAVGDPWVSKYIFPNSKLPSQGQIAEAAEGVFIEEDSHNLSTNYDKTLMKWYNNVHSNWDKLDKEKYDEKFRRMWEYYLLSCAGAFRARKIQVWQKVFSKKGLEGGYKSVR
jgi:cyclopropane-fatty-acyl-phospholipid synthase